MSGRHVVFDAVFDAVRMDIYDEEVRVGWELYPHRGGISYREFQNVYMRAVKTPAGWASWGL